LELTEADIKKSGDERLKNVQDFGQQGRACSR
jgi:hypothetical protein